MQIDNSTSGFVSRKCGPIMHTLSHHIHLRSMMLAIRRTGSYHGQLVEQEMRLIVLCITPTYLGTEPPASGPGLPYLDRVDRKAPRLTVQLATPPGRHVTCRCFAWPARAALRSHPTHVYNAAVCGVFMCSIRLLQVQFIVVCTSYIPALLFPQFRQGVLCKRSGMYCASCLLM